VVAVLAVGTQFVTVHLSQLVADMSCKFVIWDTSTGIYDGAYADKDVALERYFAMLENDPKRGWVLAEIIYPQEFRLSDDKFHAKVRTNQIKDFK
jgi:hypothetical protein